MNQSALPEAPSDWQVSFFLPCTSLVSSPAFLPLLCAPHPGYPSQVLPSSTVYTSYGTHPFATPARLAASETRRHRRACVSWMKQQREESPDPTHCPSLRAWTAYRSPCLHPCWGFLCSVHCFALALPNWSLLNWACFLVGKSGVPGWTSSKVLSHPQSCVTTGLCSSLPLSKYTECISFLLTVPRARLSAVGWIQCIIAGSSIGYSAGCGVSRRQTREYPEICEQYLQSSGWVMVGAVWLSSLPALQAQMPLRRGGEWTVCWSQSAPWFVVRRLVSLLPALRFQPGCVNMYRRAV